ncbi:MAG: amidohydrolase family protein, partial [Bdellovibrionales bacterium]|nr:amidohydrolase family protein [Bdellovibrionales bacterium]
MKIAALDLGSNTFLLLLAEVESGKITRIHHDECQVTRLAQAVDVNRAFHPDALVRAERCLKEYGAKIRQFQPDRVLAVATSAARDAQNKDEFFRIANEAGIPVKVITGDLEAKMTFRGAIDDLVPDGRCRVIDIGGGSTEYIAGQSGGKIHGQSLDMGCVRLTERFVTGHPVKPLEVEKMRLAVGQHLEGLDPAIKQGAGPLVAVAGTPTTLAAVVLGIEFDSEQIHGFRLSKAVVDGWLVKLAGMK